MEDIVAPGMKDNQTWNECVRCGKYWKSKKPIPEVLHVYNVCSKCRSNRQRRVVEDSKVVELRSI